MSKILKSVWTQPLLWWWLLGSWCKCCILFAKFISALFLLLLKKYFQQSFVLFHHEIPIEFERIYHTPGSKFSGKIWNYCEWNSRPMELAPVYFCFWSMLLILCLFSSEISNSVRKKYQIIRWIIRFFNCLMYILSRYQHGGDIFDLLAVIYVRSWLSRKQHCCYYPLSIFGWHQPAPQILVINKPMRWYTCSTLIKTCI